MPAIDPSLLAEKIAKMLDTDEQSPDIAAVFASLEKINHRLDKLEQRSDNSSPPSIVTSTIHPSLDKLSVAEAIADQIFAGIAKEKACQFEPDKPCDHCSMCSTRGF